MFFLTHTNTATLMSALTCFFIVSHTLGHTRIYTHTHSRRMDTSDIFTFVKVFLSLSLKLKSFLIRVICSRFFFNSVVVVVVVVFVVVVVIVIVVVVFSLNMTVAKMSNCDTFNKSLQSSSFVILVHVHLIHDFCSSDAFPISIAAIHLNIYAAMPITHYI